MESSVSFVERKVFENISEYCQVVFDVGARTDLVFYELRPELEYHIFEVNPNFNKVLKEKIEKIPQHKIIHNEFGLSDEDAEAIPYFPESQSTIINPGIGHDTPADFSVKVKTLEQYIKSVKLKRLDFLKIDTEGLDYGIIKAGLPAIDKLKVPFIQFEYWTGVRKFYELLSNYDLYILNEPVLTSYVGIDSPTIPLDEDMIKTVDETWIPRGLGANVFAIRKDCKVSKEKIFFEL